MTKRRARKTKLQLKKKDLRQLGADALTRAEGGLTGDCDPPTLDCPEAETDDCQNTIQIRTRVLTGYC